jgi:hypothetical protein
MDWKPISTAPKMTPILTARGPSTMGTPWDYQVMEKQPAGWVVFFKNRAVIVEKVYHPTHWKLIDPPEIDA